MVSGADREQESSGFDPDSGSVPVLAGVNIVRVSGQVFGLPATGALTSDPSESGQVVRTCEDATALQPVMYLESNASISGIYFDDDTEYQYWLDGYDIGWSSWSDETFKIYTNLNHGDYHCTQAYNKHF